MKLKKSAEKITRYEYGDYYVDITENSVEFGATITRKNCAVGMFMFGSYKEQPITENTTRKDFLDMVNWNLPEYVELYETEVKQYEYCLDAYFFNGGDIN